MRVPCKKHPGEQYRNGRCRPCAQQRARDWQRENNEWHNGITRRSYFRCTYGLEAEEIQAKMLEQKVCPICLEERPLVVDHDHNQNEPGWRGFICRECNLGLGHFRDDPDNLIRAAAYLVQ
jgi:hypothetical protein